MSRIAEIRAKRSKQAETGTHWVAKSIDVLVPILAPGDRVEILKTRKETTVVREETYGFVLEGYEGWFPARALKKLPK